MEGMETIITLMLMIPVVVIIGVLAKIMPPEGQYIIGPIWAAISLIIIFIGIGGAIRHR